MFITPADIDVKIRVYLRDERILTYGSVGVARCWLPRKKWIFFSLKMIYEITAELQLPLSTLFSSVYIASLCQTFTEKSNFKANVGGA